MGDANKFYEELARLRSLSNVCNQAGFDLDIYEDFADETYDLLKKLPEAVAVGNAEDVLLQTFTDEVVQNYIITHLRVGPHDESLVSVANACRHSRQHG